MTISLHNSLSGKLENFHPIDENNVNMYVCGITTWATPHLGNARPAVVFDVLFRLLREKYKNVNYSKNFTNIDDKIMSAAKENNETIYDLSDKIIIEYHEIVDTLGCLRPTFEPRATDTIPEMISMIETLISEGNAYVSENHVLFSVVSHKHHGMLSKHDQENLTVHRVEFESYKHDHADFVLWKPSTDDQPGWESPWGRGRPGWHIECSAMIKKTLGITIDIHGGGGDLRFPHHDCEISQSECANHAPLANYWMHNGMLLINGKKMAKSTGNFFTVRDLINKGHSGAAIRLALLQTHYRSPLDWTDNVITQAEQTLDKWSKALQPYMDVMLTKSASNPVIVALENDLNTPQAIAEIHALVSNLNKSGDVTIAATILYSLNLLGLSLNVKKEIELGSETQELLRRRSQARLDKDYALSDQIRDQLKTIGIAVKDTKDGQMWVLL